MHITNTPMSPLKKYDDDDDDVEYNDDGTRVVQEINVKYGNDDDHDTATSDSSYHRNSGFFFSWKNVERRSASPSSVNNT